jgi:uncharacterized iron-regulated membrane protein
LRFRLPPQRQDSLWLRVQAANWRGTIYLDPVTGQEQGRRGETEGFVNTLFKLHSTLLLDANGKAILAWTTLAYVLLLLTGVILWWPKRWPGNWRIELNKSLVRALFDMHRIGGVIMGLLIAVSVVTGAYMAWRPLGDWLNVLASSTAIKPPKLPALAEEGAGTLPADVTPCWPQPAQPCPMPRPVSVQLPPNAKQAVRIRFRAPASRTPTASARYGWTRATGRCWTSGAGMSRPRRCGGGRGLSAAHGRARCVLMEILAGLNGLVLGGLGISGICSGGTAARPESLRSPESADRSPALAPRCRLGYRCSGPGLLLSQPLRPLHLDFHR